jgi:quercetin dioxygenase-like cupin family protein
VQTRTRPAVRDRHIDSSILALKIGDETKRLKREPEWISGKENGITLAKYPHMRIVLVALRKGKSMHGHEVRAPLSLHVVSGKVVFTAGQSGCQLRAREIVTLRKNIPHEVYATTDSVVLLTIMAV